MRHMSSVPVVVGADAGGTTTTVAVMGADSTVLAVTTGPGANPRSSADPAGALATTFDAALTAARRRLDAAATLDVVALTAGIAGSGVAGRTRALEALTEATARCGIPDGRAHLVTDLVVAYAAAAPTPDGALLLAGTGAVAARLRGFEVVARCDGLGWLLGDIGSGVWLGLAGLRAAAAALDGRGPATALTDAALAWARDQAGTVAHRAGGADPQELVRLVDGLPPAGLGGFARAVAAAAEQGDPVATGIVDDAASGLVTTLGTVSPASSGDVVVLAGSVLTRPGPVRAAVVARLEAQGRRLRDAGTPVAGAVRLAAERAGWAVDLEVLRSSVTPV